jgi:hypothetical protein
LGGIHPSFVTNYRRNFVPGGSFFFTVNLADRRSGVLTERVDLLRSAFRYTRARHPFTIEAIVVLPDHLHAIWTLPPGDMEFPDAVAANQDGILASIGAGGTTLAKSPGQRRTRYLAAAILGAHVT